MGTINALKQQPRSDTPILLFNCQLASGETLHWSSHRLIFAGSEYEARVIGHDLFELQLSSDDAMDGLSNVSLTLGNADSKLSEIEQATGFKGAQLTIQFAFFDLRLRAATSESIVLFKGIAGDPEEINEHSMKLSFTNRLALQRVPMPGVRIQRNCPWSFPSTAAQRQEAANGGSKGKFSRLYGCGYSPDVAGGCGNFGPGGQPFTSCDGSRAQCTARGMFAKDASGKSTMRFGGVEFVPSSTLVRTHGAKTSHAAAVLNNAAKYNDPAPLVYGTGWLHAPVILSRNDGNLTSMELMLGCGQINQVLKVVVNDVEIPAASGAANPTATGWFDLVTAGARNGSFNAAFKDANGNPLGDPYGSLAVLSVVVPNRISTGGSLPTVQILLQGVSVDTYAADGTYLQTVFSNNPAWIILDILRRCGWDMADMNLPSFVAAAQFCQEPISANDLHGNPISIPRYQCNLILDRRQSAAQVIRGIRTASSLMLRYGINGALELIPETSLSRQQSAPVDGSNSTSSLAGGWPAYEFSDASAPFSGISRLSDGSSSVRLTARSNAEISNRLSVEFQDEWNEYQHDSLSVSNSDDVELIGYEVTSTSTALGLPNMSQATRVLLRQLDKQIGGNQLIQFQTTFRGLKIRPGDLITVTYAKEGLVRVPFRVLKLSPSANYEFVTIVAQFHNDAWYSDDISVLSASGRQPHGSDVPRPLIGTRARSNAKGIFECFDFGVTDSPQSNPDGSALDTITVAYSVPAKVSAASLSVPTVSLSPTIDNTGGTLAGGSALYYAVTAVSQDGAESHPSFTIAATTPADTATNSVTLTGLSFPSTASSFNVYRGTSPQELYRISSSAAIGATFTDRGNAPTPVGMPDSAFDHANFYYRWEVGGPWIATGATGTTIFCQNMGAVPLAYVGMIVRITDGSGAGQERSITTNDAVTITVASPWTDVPDRSSTFVITEPSWHFAAVGAVSPMQFQVPYRAGTVVQITGRGANAHNVEGVPELCPITRFALGGGQSDAGTTVSPSYTLAAAGEGTITLSQIGFTNLANTSSVTSGTLQVFGFNELAPASAGSLASAIDSNQTVLTVLGMKSPYIGQLVQIGSELMIILGAGNPAGTYTVQRGAMGTSSVVHQASAPILELTTNTVIVPFARGMFGNRASVNFQQITNMPDMRISASQFYVTNAFGDSEASLQNYTNAPGGGLRTLSGGQFSLQVSGPIAAQASAVPPLLIQNSHAVRDVRASVAIAPAGYSLLISLLQGGQPYVSLTIPDGQSVSSEIIDGSTLACLTEGATISMSVALSPTASYSGISMPGRDLTVTIRL